MESIYQNIIMKRNKKEKRIRIIGIALAVLLLCTLSGCGAGRVVEEIVTENMADAQEGAAEAENQAAEQEENETAPKTETDEEKEPEEGTETDGEELGGEAEEENKPITMAELMAGGGTERLPDTILWFNATYAPLTYSNMGNWKLVGGLRPTEENKELVQYLLYRDWNISIDDAEEAMETVERLKNNGHREKCRECMEELEEMGILELEEEAFFAGLSDSGIEENIFRYVIAYYMYQDGLDADYIAAWDLCRVNQLYADFYICGYMTYEEAMDASFENSLILRKMYSSWDEMVSAYMLGYQFWQSDPCLTDDSPTMERYHCYEMLLEMEDGPYTLDWDMKFQKSW